MPSRAFSFFLCKRYSVKTKIKSYALVDLDSVKLVKLDEFSKAGEMASISEDGAIAVEEFSAADIPEFAMVEIKEDDALMESVDALKPENAQEQQTESDAGVGQIKEEEIPVENTQVTQAEQEAQAQQPETVTQDFVEQYR